MAHGHCLAAVEPEGLGVLQCDTPGGKLSCLGCAILGNSNESRGNASRAIKHRLGTGRRKCTLGDGMVLRPELKVDRVAYLSGDA